MRQRLADSIATTRRLLESDCVKQTVHAAEVIAASLHRGGRVFFFGNGGSSMDAGHLAAELVGRFHRERPPLPAIGLADQTAAITAIGNDYGYDEVFARQLTGLGRPGDVAVGLTTSGTSPNVVRGLEQARALGLATVVLTGRTGGRATSVADICIQVPSDDTPRIQETCMHLGHSICELVDEWLFPDAGRPPTATPRDRCP